MLAVLFLVSFAKLLEAAGPRQETLRAWDEYTQVVNLRLAQNAGRENHFLWIDESPDLAWRVHQNEIVVIDRDPKNIPQGMIHHWVGAVFVPDATLDQAMTVVESFDRYSEFYKPLFSKCTVLARDTDQATLNVVAAQKVLSVTAAVDTEDQVKVVRMGPRTAYLTNNAVRIQEIADYGQPTEHPFSESRRPGYVWRQIGVERLEERDGGVYVELETIILSRGIPAAFHWLIKPLADELPRKLMHDTLSDTRTAILQGVVLSRSQRAASSPSR